MTKIQTCGTNQSLVFPIMAALVCLLVAFLTYSNEERAFAEEAANVAEESSVSGEAVTLTDHYLIGAGDVLEIVVWKEPDVSRTVRVRPDGKISMPLVDDVQAAGGTPLQLKQRLTEALARFVEEPSVYVILEENRSKTYHIIGKVNSPGPYLLERDTTVLEALAMARGFTEWAKKDDVIIVRKGHGSQLSINFNYNEVVSGKEIEQNILLNPGDVIIVP